MKTTFIILAGGASTRMGAPKALVEFNGEPMVLRAARTASQLGNVIVVAGDVDRHELERLVRPARVIHNDDWRDGMASSIVAGVLAAETDRTICIWAVDQPLVTARDLDELIRATATADAAAAMHDGQPGIPACFATHMRPRLLALTGDHGARELLRSERFEVATIDTIDARDADTVAQLEKLEAGDAR